MSVEGEASRRAVLLGMGAVGAAGILTACGGGEPDTPSQPAGTTPGGGGGDGTTGATPPDGTPSGIPVAFVPVGGAHIDFDRRVVVTQPEAGQYQAFDATCTHEYCMVTWVEEGLITCPCHGSQFRISDGSVARGPATRSLDRRTVTVEGDVIVIS